MWVAVTSWEAQINILTWMGRSDALKMDFNLQIGLKVPWDLAHSVDVLQSDMGCHENTLLGRKPQGSADILRAS